MHPLVDLGAQPRDLALADPAHAHRLDQLVHRAGGDALDVRFLDHGGEGFLGRAARLEETGEVAALAQLGDLQIHRPRTRLPQSLAVTVAAVEPFRASLAVKRGAQALDVHLHHPLGDELDHVPQQIGVGALLGKLGECDSVLGGHRGAPWQS